MNNNEFHFAAESYISLSKSKKKEIPFEKIVYLVTNVFFQQASPIKPLEKI